MAGLMFYENGFTLHPFRFLRDKFLGDSLALIGRYFENERKSLKKLSHRFSVS